MSASRKFNRNGHAFKTHHNKQISKLGDYQNVVKLLKGDLQMAIIGKQTMAIALLATWFEVSGHIEISAESYDRARKVIEEKGIAIPTFIEGDENGLLIAFNELLKSTEPTKTPRDQIPNLPIQKRSELKAPVPKDDENPQMETTEPPPTSE